MGIPIVRFERRDGLVSWGRFESGLIRPIPGEADNLGNFLANRVWKQSPTREEFRPGEVKFLSPVTAPCQIVCQGKNYSDHRAETGVKSDGKGDNILFTKADSCLAPPVTEVRRPGGVRLLDYELELGLVIGAPVSAGVTVTPENLHEFVYGLVMANDISARDVQVPQRQWFKGKSFRGFCPVGPVLYLFDPEEIPLLQDMEMQLCVNGEVRQRANTSQLIHGPADTLREISRIFDLRPGDLLLTGTPGGVAMRVKAKSWFGEFMGTFQNEQEKFRRFVEEQARNPRYLKDGDKVESTLRSADGRIDLGKQSWTVVT